MNACASVSRLRRATLAGVAAGILAECAVAAEPGPARYGVVIQDVAGMPAGIADVAQDTDGFLWIASEEGLFRFDGAEFVRWGERMALQQIESGPHGSVVAHAYHGPLVERRDDEVTAVRDAAGEPLDAVADARFDDRGNLWVVQEESVSQRDLSGDWLATPVAGGVCVAPLRAGGVAVGTWDGRIVVLDRGMAPRLAASGLGGLVRSIAEDERGRLVATVRGGPRAGIVRLERGAVERLVAIAARPTGFALRRGSVWTSWDDGVVVVRSDGSAERLGPLQGFEGGGSLFVDREGSLWLTSFEGGLARFPEPDTAIWTGASGLPHTAIRQVVAGADACYAFSWHGALRFDEREGTWRPIVAPPQHALDLGSGDPDRGLWTSGFRVDPGDGRARGVLLRVEGDRVEPAGPERGDAPWLKGAEAPDGSMWLAFGRDLLVVPARGAAPRSAAAIPDEIDAVWGIAVSPGGEIWLAGRDGPLCAFEPESRRWRCSRPDGLEGVMAMRFTGSGALWVASGSRGLLVCGDDRSCRVTLDRDALGSDAAVWIEPSPRGGMWVVSKLAALRAVEAPEGVRIVERITRAHGVPRWWLASVHESEDGTLWIAALGGIARVPSAARGREDPSPPVRVTQVSIAGAPVPRGTEGRAVAGRETVSVHWAALSFADPSRLRFRFRLHDGDPWSESDHPRVTLVAPEAGSYRIQTQASVDGEIWSGSPASVAVRVVPPWYGRTWFWCVVAATAAGAALVAHRLRVGQLLRLERQRAEIAMDLHDDLGATLGGIGLLAAMAADPSAAAPVRVRALERIARQSGAASGTLSEIVWSLRPGTETLDQLVFALRERVADLAPDGRVEVRVEAPEEGGRERLAFAVRRNVLWIGVEAVRNALRHATPANVRVTLERRDDGWCLSVEDDGVGLPAERPRGAKGGLGMESMRRRADAIGGRLSIRAAAGSGTYVELAFRTDGRRPRMIV